MSMLLKILCKKICSVFRRNAWRICFCELKLLVLSTIQHVKAFEVFKTLHVYSVSVILSHHERVDMNTLIICTLPMMW